MFWKDNLSKVLLSSEILTYQSLVALQQDFPSLRVKTADANGRIPVIQLEEKGQWMKPREWAVNHQAALKQRLLESQQRVLDATSDPGVLLNSVRSLLCPADCHFDDDLKEIDRLESQLQTVIKEKDEAVEWNDLALELLGDWGEFLEYILSGGRKPDNVDYSEWIDQFHNRQFLPLPKQLIGQNSQGSKPHKAE